MCACDCQLPNALKSRVSSRVPMWSILSPLWCLLCPCFSSSPLLLLLLFSSSPSSSSSSLRPSHFSSSLLRSIFGSSFPPRRETCSHRLQMCDMRAKRLRAPSRHRVSCSTVKHTVPCSAVHALPRPPAASWGSDRRCPFCHGAESTSTSASSLNRDCAALSRCRLPLALTLHPGRSPVP